MARPDLHNSQPSLPVQAVRRDGARPPPPPSLLWQLWFRPASFFAEVQRQRPMPLVAAAVLLTGISLTTGRGLAGALPKDSWLMFWAVSLVSGVVGGFFSYVFGGYWYGLRLRWSGGQGVTDELARDVWVLAGLVQTAPGVLHGIWATVVYESPASSFLGALVVHAVFAPWCCWVNYQAARTVFGAHGRPAVVLFLVLPVLYAAWSALPLLSMMF